MNEEELEEELSECPSPRCGGEMMTYPHLSYWFCDSCGTRERKVGDSDYD